MSQKLGKASPIEQAGYSWEGYVRLSRTELRDVGSFEEKVARHIEILLRLARDYNVPLTREQIHVELRSGEKLENRPALQGILQRCRSRQTRGVLTMSMDRLTRSMVDQDTIAKAFFDGATVLVTSEGVTVFDTHLDLTPWQAKSMVAEMERGRTSFRSRIHNEARASRGVRSQGFAPYGYRWVCTQYAEDHRTVVTPGHYEIVPDEYPTVEYIFRAIYDNGINAIVGELNRRLRETGAPLPPGQRRRPGAASDCWIRSSLRAILSNPFYAGYPAHRHQIGRGTRRTHLPRDEWILPDQPLDYPHPLSDLAAWEELVARIRNRSPHANMPTNITNGLLTGLLRCPAGKPMASSGPTRYGCICSHRAEPHLVGSIDRGSVDTAVVAALRAYLASGEFNRLIVNPPEIDRNACRHQYRAIQRALEQEERVIEDMMRSATTVISIWGEAMYREKADAVQKRVAELRAQCDALAAMLATPDASEQRTITEAMRQVGKGDLAQGFDIAWAQATFLRRREVLQSFVSSVQIDAPPPPYKRCRTITIHWHKQTKADPTTIQIRS